MSEEFFNNRSSQQDDNKDKPKDASSQWRANHDVSQNPPSTTIPNSAYYPHSYTTRQYAPFYPPISQGPYAQAKSSIAGVSPYPVWQMNSGQPHPHPNPYCGDCGYPNSTAASYLPLAPISRSADQLPHQNQTPIQAQNAGTDVVDGRINNDRFIQQDSLAQAASSQPRTTALWQAYATPYPSDAQAPIPSKSPMQPSTPMSQGNTPFAGSSSSDCRNKNDQGTQSVLQESRDDDVDNEEEDLKKQQSLFSEVIGDRLIKSLKAASASRNNHKKIIPPDLVRAMSGAVDDEALDARTLVLKNIASIYKSWDDHETGSRVVLEYIKPLWEDQLNAYLTTARCLYYNNQYRCRKCEAPVSHLEFWKHIFPDHGAADIMPLKCLFCESQFNVPNAWEAHVMGCYNLTIFLVSQLQHMWQVSMIRNYLVGHLKERMEKFNEAMVKEYHERFS